MTYYTGQTYTKEHNGRAYRIRLELDYHADSSELGTYTDKPDDVVFCVWRADGTLRGAMPPEPEEPDADAYGVEPWNKDDPAYDSAYDAYLEALEDWDENGPEILADGLPRMWAREYRYFVPFCGGYTGANVEAGKIDQAEWAKYAVQDYKRAEGLNRGQWGYVGVVVEVDAPACGCCGHVETLDASLWNCESDYSDSDFDAMIDELIHDLEHQLNKYDLAREAHIVL